MSLFSAFWSDYPARNGKKLEKSETQTRFFKLKPPDQALCATAAKHYAESEMVKKGIGIKDPKRFIRDGKGSEPWRDWIEPEKPSEERKAKSGGNGTGAKSREDLTNDRDARLLKKYSQTGSGASGKPVF
jgi:hypothetical protein